MSVEHLRQLWASKVLIQPSDQKHNLIHLVRAVATIAGVSDLDSSQQTRDIVGLIPPTDHLIFVLLDGLGMNIIRRMPADSFLVKNLRHELNAVSPSTTACALTSVTTAQYPTRHAITGWFTYIPERDLTIATLPFVERYSNEWLAKRDIKAEDLLPMPPICPKMTRAVLTIVPWQISNTTYNTWSRAGTQGIGYQSIPSAIDQIISHIAAATEPTYTHLYLPEIDTLCHKIGVDDPGVVPLVQKIDAELSRLCDAVNKHATIIVSADHGLIDVPKAEQTLLMHDDPLIQVLRVPPTGDARMPIFHVREGMSGDFVDQFESRFEEKMVLVKTDEVEELEMFGPKPMSAISRPRFGDFVAIPFKPATISFHPPNKPLGHLYLAVHAGMSPQEMLVPLCVA
jgi:hypothetical protein